MTREDRRRSSGIVHVVRSDAFAGVERYICVVTNELSRRGHRVRVVGGDPARMRAELDEKIEHTPAASVGRTWLALASLGRVGVVHAHMTAAEAAAVFSRFRHRAPIVSTRHFPGRRGSGMVGRRAASRITQGLAAQIATSAFVAQSIEEPTMVVHHGLPSRPQSDLAARRVLMLQRLEEEKAPAIGVRAWAMSGLASEGWHLTLAGSGRLEPQVRQLCTELGIEGSVRFLGHVDDTDRLLEEGSILLAPAPSDSFGLAVVEAMAHGVPVIAAAGGGHVETVGDDGCLFEPGDTESAASLLRRVASDESYRREVGEKLRARQQLMFSLEPHIDELEKLYAAVSGDRKRTRAAG